MYDQNKKNNSIFDINLILLLASLAKEIKKRRSTMMHKCLKITFGTAIPEGFLHDFVQKNAKKLNLEGVVQIVPAENRIKVIVCGGKDAVDQFVDLLHKGSGKTLLDDIQIEPYLKDKDYRGVFRVIE